MASAATLVAPAGGWGSTRPESEVIRRLDSNTENPGGTPQSGVRVHPDEVGRKLYQLEDTRPALAETHLGKFKRRCPG